MKLKESDFQNILKNRLSGVPAMLLYGPDNGKINDFVDKIISTLSVDSDNLVTADTVTFRDGFDGIYSNACSVSMFGGDKLIIIHDPDGRDMSLVENLCGSLSLCAPVIITAGELESSSKIRTFFEGSEKCIALPLYADDDDTLGVLIKKTLKDSCIEKIDPDALSYMFQHLGKDRAIARQFLQKIALYVSDKKSVSLDDVENCLPDTGAASMDEFKYSLTAGNITKALRAMDRMFAENVNPAQMVRALGNHFKDLLNCVVGGQMPRVFWKYNQQFEIARRIWTSTELENVLLRMESLETETRTTALDGELMFRDFALKLATRTYKMSITKRGK